MTPRRQIPITLIALVVLSLALLAGPVSGQSASAQQLTATVLPVVSWSGDQVRGPGVATSEAEIEIGARHFPAVIAYAR